MRRERNRDRGGAIGSKTRQGRMEMRRETERQREALTQTVAQRD